MLNWNSWSVNCRFVGCPGQRRALYCGCGVGYCSGLFTIPSDWVGVVGERDFSRWLLDCCVMCTRGICTRIYGGFKFPPPQPPTSSHNKTTHRPSTLSLSVYLSRRVQWSAFGVAGVAVMETEDLFIPDCDLTFYFVSFVFFFRVCCFGCWLLGLLYNRRKTRTTTTLE